MKNIKYIILSIIVLGLSSCGDDSFTRVYVDDEVKTELEGVLTITNLSTDIYTHDEVGFTITLPQAFEVESTVEVTIKSLYNALAITPNMQKILVVIPAGSTTFSDSFEMPSFDNVAPFGGISDFLSVSITGIKLTLPDDGSVEDPYTMTSEPVLINLFEPNSWSTGGVAGALLYSIDWPGPYDLNDLDLYLFGYSGGVIGTRRENSEGGVRFEGDFINNPANENYPDGDYIVEIGLYTSVDDSPVPYRLVFAYPDGSREVYEGTVDPAIGYVNPVIVTKSTGPNGERLYSTSPNI